MATSFWGSFFCGQRKIMNILDLNKITQSFAGNDILCDVTFAIDEQEKVAIVGRNGSGKSTLLKIITQESQPQSGTIAFQKETKIAYISQRLKVIEHQTVLDILKSGFQSLISVKKAMIHLENKMASGEILSEKDYDRYGKLLDDFQLFGGYEMEAKIESVANGLSIDNLLSKEWQNLSGGQKAKVKLALSLVQVTNLLVLDEPTNHLDLTTDWLIDHIKHYRGAVIIASHDRHFIDQIATKVIEIEDGLSSIYNGNYSFYFQEKQKRIALALQKYRNQQDRVKKMKQSIRQLQEWAHTYHNEKFASRARSMQKALDKIEVFQRPRMVEKNMVMNLTKVEKSSKIIFEAKDIVFQVEKQQDLLKNITFTVKRGNRVAILGDNGVGKSTLLKLLLGLEEVTSGSIYTGPNLSIGYFSQFESELETQKTIIESYINQVPMSEADARYQLSKFLFFNTDVFKKVCNLSGGERKRLRWAQIIGQNPNVLVLDKPTNDLDIGSIEMLEDTLDDYQGTVIAVSHDRYFVNNHFDTHYALENKPLIKL